MRRYARILAPAVMAIALTAACGGSDSTTSGESEPTESSPAEDESGAPTRGDADLVIWTDAGPGKVAGARAVADTFAEEQGISVEVQTVASDLQTNFVTANEAGNGPDVVVGAHDWIGNLIQNGSIEPLQLTPDALSAYSEKAVQATTYDGQLYGVPYGVETLGLYRNTDVAPDEPATMDDAIAAGQQARKAGEVDSALNLPVGELGDAYHMQPILTSMGGYLFGYDEASGYDAADVGIGKPGSLAAADEISQLAKQKVLRTSISGDNSIALFAEGKAAFLVSGPWALADLAESDVNYAVQPIPGFQGEDPAEPFMGAQAFMVASNAQNAAFAQEFVSTGVNSEEAMQTLYDETKLPPALTSLQDSIGDEEIATFAEAANEAAPMPAIPEMATVWEPLGKAYAAIVSGSPPEKTMKQAGNQINSAIGN
jgi:arabinogalactan oligomer/maltooligosaccharide transport system substrate-binding protein